MAKKTMKIEITNAKGYSEKKDGKDYKKLPQCYFKGKVVVAGDSFTVDDDDQDARILLAIGRAEVVEGKPKSSEPGK